MAKLPLAVQILFRIGISPRTVVLVVSDLLALVGTAVLAFFCRALFGNVEHSLYHWVLPLLCAGPCIGASLGLYRSIPLPPHKELKAVFHFVSLIYGLILIVLFLSKESSLYSRIVIMGSWVATLFAVPILRGLCTRLFSRRSWWSAALVILGKGGLGKNFWHYLKRHPERGLRPVEILDLSAKPEHSASVMQEAALRWPRAVALILPSSDEGSSHNFVGQVRKFFGRVLIVPDFEDSFRRYWLEPCELAGLTALMLSQNLHDRRRLLVKRGIDLFFCFLILPLLLPLGLLIGLLIKLDSAGPVLYRQKRLGRHGREIRVYKFRTMKVNADALLKEYLAQNPALRKEWLVDHKLRHDPRVTRMGRFLRKTSLDELPQILNVLKGEMSLVGPRPIVADEIFKYGEVYEEYSRVRPGLTGLWQISGRNDTSYAERVAYDHYYINNWSVWMDIWILCRTVPVVLTGYGAY